MDPIKLILVDDHSIIRDGIKAILETEYDFSIIGEAESGHELFKKINIDQADVILMDINMPKQSGIEVTKSLKEKFPDIKVLALSMSETEDDIKGIIQAGALGYVSKHAGKQQLITAIKTVADGNCYYSKEVVPFLVNNSENKKHQHTNTEKLPTVELTNRELEILKLITEEYTNQEIAEKLFISQRTVDTHRRNLLQKTGVKNTAGLVKYALNKGLISYRLFSLILLFYTLQ